MCREGVGRRNNSRPCLPPATRAARSLTLISQSCTQVHTRSPGCWAPRPRDDLPLRRRHCAPPARGSTRRSPARPEGRRRPRAAAARAEGGGGGRPVHGGRGGTASVRAWTVTWSLGGEWPHTHRGMRACVSVCACTTVRPLAWAAALSSQNFAFSSQRHAPAHAHASTAGWPTRHTRPAAARCSSPGHPRTSPYRS